jgi:hypothetical protein
VTSADEGLRIELVGDIVRMLALLGGGVPAPYVCSAKLVAGAHSNLDLLLRAQAVTARG